MGSSSEPVLKKSGFNFWRETLNSAKYILAPMVDQSELAWRMLSRRYGAELCYTPMFLASVFNRDPTYRKVVMATCEKDRPLIVQFCANNPESLIKAAKYVENNCDAVDLNIGCPQSIAKRGHYGAFLQDEWDLLHDMVSLCHRELKVPITCKIRIYEDVDKTVRYAQMLEKAGAQLLTVHGRTKEQKGINMGLASWKHIAAVKQNVKIPVIANGNIQYFHDIPRCMTTTGVDGVMVAEGNLHNPAIFTEELLPVCRLATEYLDMVEMYPCPVAFVRGHLFKLLHHALCVHSHMRDILGVSKTTKDIRDVVTEIERLSLPDIEKYERDSQSGRSDPHTPYWICQPYIRPETGERVQQKRTLSSTNDEGSEENGNVDQNVDNISHNKLKKLKRNCNKSFQPKKLKFEICTCGHPKGLKCSFDKCKICCKVLVFKMLQECPGHKLFLKRKRHSGNPEVVINSNGDLKSNSPAGNNNDNSAAAAVEDNNHNGIESDDVICRDVT